MLKSFERGFTVIELITIIVLLSIIGIVAFGRLANINNITDRSFFYDTVTALRYAQKLAVSTGCEVEVNLNINGFSLHQRTNDCTVTTNPFSLDVVDPVDRTSPYELSSTDITISSTPALPVSFQFTAQSTVDNLGTTNPSRDFTVNGQSFTVYRHTALVDVP